jgi:HlyD family secretion protein
MKIVRVLLILLLITGLGAGAYYLYTGYQQSQVANQSKYQTLTLARGDLTATVGATGTVRSNQTAILGWQTTGAIDTIVAALGSEVRKGDTLAALDKTSLPQNIVLAQADLVNALRTLDNLRNSQIAKAQAQSNLLTLQKTLDDAQKNRDNLKWNRGTPNQIEKARTDFAVAVKDVSTYQDLYNQYKNGSETDVRRVSALNALVAAQRRRDLAKWNLDWFLGKPSEQDIAEADARLALAKAQFNDAQREWDRLKNGPDPADISAAQARVDAIQATLNLQTIKAPFDGTITDIKAKVGDQVNPGTAAFRIDDLTPLIVDVQISEVDINRISIGQAVNMTFDAIQGKQYAGNVSGVGKVGTAVSGSVNFTVTIELTNPDEAVRPGMTAAVNIVVNQLNNALLVPNRAVRLKDGQRVVYVLVGGTPTVTPIVLGASSESFSEVASGNVKEGDQVVLNPPTELSSGGSPFGGR